MLICDNIGSKLNFVTKSNIIAYLFAKEEDKGSLMFASVSRWCVETLDDKIYVSFLLEDKKYLSENRQNMQYVILGRR